MHLPVRLLLLTGLLAAAGCKTATRVREYPASPANFDAKTRDQIKRGVIELGFTPEMVYMALGKPTEPAANIVDATRDGTWVYRDFHGHESDFVRPGFRRRIVSDPARHADIVVTEPVDTKGPPPPMPRSVQVTFHEGRVVEIQRAADL